MCKPSNIHGLSRQRCAVTSGMMILCILHTASRYIAVSAKLLKLYIFKFCYIRITFAWNWQPSISADICKLFSSSKTFEKQIICALAHLPTSMCIPIGIKNSPDIIILKSNNKLHWRRGQIVTTEIYRGQVVEKWHKMLKSALQMTAARCKKTALNICTPTAGGCWKLWAT